MSKKIKVEVNICFEMEETGTYPAMTGLAIVTATAEDGSSFRTQVKYDGQERMDIIRTLTRMDHFKRAVASQAIAALPQDGEVQILEREPVPEASFDDLAETPEPTVDEKVEAAQAERFKDQRDAFYVSLHKDIQTWAYGKIRKFCTDNFLQAKVANGGNKIDIATEICEEFRRKEDASNEKNNQS